MSGARFVEQMAEAAFVAADRRIVLADTLGTVSGNDMWAAVGQAAAELTARGLRPGDRTILLNENAVATVVGYLACLRCGAWPILINARLTAAEIARIADHARPRLHLFTTAASDAAQRHAAKSGATALESRPDLSVAIAGEPGTPEPVDDDPARRVAALIYTSGTTGEPKGVMLTHANLLFVAGQSAAIRSLSPADHVYGALPVSHVFGLASVLLGSLGAGARLDLVARFEPDEAAAALGRGVTVFQGVPTMFARLLEIAERQGGRLDAPALRYMSCGGAPLDPALKARVEALLGLPLHNGYGLTETAPTVTTTREEAPATDDHVGPALPGVEIRIADPATGQARATGEVGEIWVRGPGVMRGYYRAPEATAAVMASDGWFRSGDLGRLDAQGNLYVVGRLKELIIRSGFNVYPPEVEAVLTAHPDVALAAVVGRKVEGNEEVVAFLEPRPGRTIDVAALAAFAAERLAPYKRPAHYHVATALPVTAAGKIRKAELARGLTGRV